MTQKCGKVWQWRKKKIAFGEVSRARANGGSWYPFVQSAPQPVAKQYQYEKTLGASGSQSV
jgi:hypothetical protein